MLKKGLCLLLAVIMLFSLSGCSEEVLGSALFLFFVITSDDRADKDDVFDFVSENEEELLKAIENGDFSEYENRGFIKDIEADETVIDFSCGGAGMGSATSYVGFYYSPEDDMAAVWCAPYSEDSLIASGDGFSWQGDGDNRYYTEHICGNFYYYEASF